MLPAALYGTETARCNINEMQALRTAITDVIGPRSARRCIAMVYETCSGGTDLDPQVQQLVRKVALLKRMMAKFPSICIKVKSAIYVYKREGKKGAGITFGCALDAQPHLGPIGHLLTQLDQVGANLTSDFDIIQEQETDINVVATPWQTIKKQVEYLARRSRTRQASADRTYLGGIQELDHAALRDAMVSRPNEDKHVLQYILTGSTWTAEKLYKLGHSSTDRCALCGALEPDIRHGLWQCAPVRAKATEMATGQAQAAEKLCASDGNAAICPVSNGRKSTSLGAKFCCKDLDHCDLPMCLQVGLPPAMAKTHGTTFWGTSNADLHTPGEEARSHVGIPKTKFQKVLAECHDLEAQEIYDTMDTDNAMHAANARQAFQTIRGNTSLKSWLSLRPAVMPRPMTLTSIQMALSRTLPALSLALVERVYGGQGGLRTRTWSRPQRKTITPSTLAQSLLLNWTSAK